MNQSLYFVNNVDFFLCASNPLSYWIYFLHFGFLNYLLYKWEYLFVVSVKIIKSKSVPTMVPTSAEKNKVLWKRAACLIKIKTRCLPLLTNHRQLILSPAHLLFLVYIFILLLYYFRCKWFDSLGQRIGVYSGMR